MAVLKIIGIVFSVLVTKDAVFSCSLPSHISGSSLINDSTPPSHRSLASWKSSHGPHRSDFINKMPGTSTDFLSHPSKLGPILEPSTVSINDNSVNGQLLNDFLLMSLFSTPFTIPKEPLPLPNSLNYDSSPKLPSTPAHPYPKFDQNQADLQLLSILLSNSGPNSLSTPTSQNAVPSTTSMPLTVSLTYLNSVSSITTPEPDPNVTPLGITVSSSVTTSGTTDVSPSAFEPIVVASLEPSTESDIVSTTISINTSPAASHQNITI